MTTLHYLLPLLCIIAICIILFQLGNIFLAFKSYFWKTTTATISDFRIDTTKEDESCFFKGKIKFEYEVNDKKFFGDKICFSNSLTNCCPNSTLGKYLQNAFQKNQPIKIFYDPSNPQNATIKNGISTDMYFSMFGLVLFLSVSVFSFL